MHYLQLFLKYTNTKIHALTHTTKRVHISLGSGENSKSYEVGQPPTKTPLCHPLGGTNPFSALVLGCTGPPRSNLGLKNARDSPPETGTLDQEGLHSLVGGLRSS